MATHASDGAGEEFSELSMELQHAEWLSLSDRSLAERRLMPGHWSLELSLVLFGVLLGVALYFGASY